MTRLTSLVLRVRAWVGKPLGRALLVLCGLGVLSLVGRYAVAGGQAPPAMVAALPTVGVPTLAPTMAAATLTATATATATATVTAMVTAPDPVPVPHARTATEDDPVYLNDATLEDLRRLPGVGEKRGLAILELRRKVGRFHQIEDLLHVKGIGRSTLRRLRPLVRLDSAGAALHPDGGRT